MGENGLKQPDLGSEPTPEDALRRVNETRAHPLYVRPSARRVLGHLLGRVLPRDWTVMSLARRDARTLELGLKTPHADLQLSWCEPHGTVRKSVVQGPHYAVSLAHGVQELAAETTEHLPVLRSLAHALAHARPPGLIFHPVASTTTEVERRDVFLEPQSLARWLEPSLSIGSPVLRAKLTGIESEADGVALVLERAGASIRVLITLPSSKEALFHSPHFCASYREPTSLSPGTAARITFEIGMRMETQQRATRFLPPRGTRVLPRADRPPGALTSFQASLDGPCGQACSFCCLRPAERKSPAPTDSAPHLEGMRDAVRRGAKIFRLNGIEPFKTSFALELVSAAGELGFEEMRIKSTCRAFAEREFAQRFVEAATINYRVDIPLYGSTARLHDHIVSAPGAYDEVLRGASNLLELMDGRGRLCPETVIVPDNVDDLADLSRLWATMGVSLSVHLPHPTGPRAPTIYPGVALPFGAVLAAVFPGAGPPVANLRWGEVPACAEVRHEQRSGAPCVTLARVRQRQRSLSGVLYADSHVAFESGNGDQIGVSDVTACPHRSTCFAAPVCPASVYALYAAERGLDELEPVTRADVAGLADGHAVVEEIERAARAVSAPASR